MFEEEYRKEMDEMVPSREEMERLKQVLREGGRRTRPVRRGVLVAAVLCGVLAISALAVSPCLREQLSGLLGSYTAYTQPVEGAA